MREIWQQLPEKCPLDKTSALVRSSLLVFVPTQSVTWSSNSWKEPGHLHTELVPPGWASAPSSSVFLASSPCHLVALILEGIHSL